MKKCQSCGELMEYQNLCWCGFDNTLNKQLRCTANEEFIYFNTKTSHKRFESMVVYALHFALRDLELRSQYHVQVGNNTYLIDLYAPALNLAIEIDEPYHLQIDQKANDANREKNIKEKLGCEFYRFDCNKPIYNQVDMLVSMINQHRYDNWKFERPNYQRNSGEYAAKHWKKLEESGVILDVENLKEKFSKELGFLVDNSPVDGIPGRSNGEYGFIVSSNVSPHKLAIYARASHKWHVRIVKTDSPNEQQMQVGQRKRNGEPRFYKIREIIDGTKSIETVTTIAIKWLSCSK